MIFDLFVLAGLIAVIFAPALILLALVERLDGRSRWVVSGNRLVRRSVLERERGLR